MAERTFRFECGELVYPGRTWSQAWRLLTLFTSLSGPEPIYIYPEPPRA